MKKIMAGVIALMLIAGTTAFAAEKKPGKKARAKKECKMQDCKDKKDCKNTTECPKTCNPSTCGK